MPDLNNLVACDTCGYPHFDNGMGCPNPACFANPSMTRAKKDRMIAERNSVWYDKNERERIHQIRVKAMDTAARRHEAIQRNENMAAKPNAMRRRRTIQL